LGGYSQSILVNNRGEVMAAAGGDVIKYQIKKVFFSVIVVGFFGCFLILEFMLVKLNFLV
jgi:hypothetical protein